MAVTFKGFGLVYIPERNRCIRFVNGEYSTDDEAEIAVLAKKWEHSGIKPDDPIVDNAPADEPADDKPKRGRPKNAER